MPRDLTVAVLRPDDGRCADTADLVESLGATPVRDPMLAVEATGDAPRADADYVILTSTTGVDLAAGTGWTPGDATVCAVGDTTAAALRDRGYAVDVVPAEFSSSGLVAALADEVAGARVEIARSDHGSDVLPDGLGDAGAYVHETTLYRLVRPPGSGESAELAATGDLDAVLFTSSLTVEHWLDAAEERGVRDAAVAGLADATVGVIGEPTQETAAEAGLPVDVVPEAADVEALTAAVVEAAAPTYHE